jgi:prolyl oligopeptidase
VLRVPVVNLIRMETSTTGPGNVPEYGSLRVAAEFRSMLASDPYHRIRDHANYPAVLLTAGKHDPRVPAWEPAKFAARLQAIPHARPVLLRVEADAGHGIGSTQTQREEEFADIYAFALWQSAIDANRHTHQP